MTMQVLVNPSDSFLEQERSRVAAGPIKVAEPAQPVASTVRPLAMLPAAIEVEYWREEDDTWTAHSPLLGVTAVADTEAELFAEAAEAVEEFWRILNDKYSTLSDDLRNLLDLRFQTLKFTPRT